MTDEFDDLLKQFEDGDAPSKVESDLYPILIIDDDDSIRRALSRVFSHKYEVLTSECGRDAVDTLTDAVHCVILDVKMKEQNGFATYPKLKAKSPNVPIIFYTAFQSEHDLQNVINKFKPEGYVDKGRDITFLDNLVGNAVAKYQLILENEAYKQDLEKRVEERTEKLSDAFEELKATQAHLVQQGTMASVGRLAIGIAHNIRNPLETIKRSITEIIEGSITLLYLPQETQRFGFAKEDSDKLLKFISGKYFQGSNIEFLDTRKLKEMAEAFQEHLSKWQIKLEKRELRNLASLNITPKDLTSLSSFFQRYNPANIISLLKIGFSVGVSSVVALDATSNAIKLINATMSYANVKNRTKNECHLNAAIHSVLTLMKGQLNKYQISVVTDLNEDIPVLNINESLLNQVFENLISNAIYSMKGIDGKRELSIRTRLREKGVILEVADTGVGIPETFKEEIFRPFFTTKPEGEGTGIGLYTVYQVIKDIGLIDVESQPGFTKFEIQIDLDKLNGEGNDGLTKDTVMD